METDNLKKFRVPEERMKYINEVMASIFEALPSKITASQ